MEISPDKTKVMINNPNGFQREIKIKGQRLEKVENFKYLEAIISNEGSKPDILPTFEPPHDKTNKMTVYPAKTQISLGIRPVWSVFAVRSMDSLGLNVSSCGEDWSDWADAQADQSLLWAQMPFCWFWHEVAHL